MAQIQEHGARNQVLWLRQDYELKTVGSSGSVPGNKKCAVFVAVALHVACRVTGIGVTAKRIVVATPAFGFGRAGGGSSIKKLAPHITNRSSSFRPSASTGRAKARRLA